MKGLKNMDFLNDLMGFEIITELPRELTTEEILGRRFFTDFKRRFTCIDTIGEPETWTTYSIRMDPIVVSFANLPLLTTVRYKYNKVTNILNLTFEKDALPIEVRTLTQHIFNEAHKWQKKKK
jgi:hypothetical protein